MFLFSLILVLISQTTHYNTISVNPLAFMIYYGEGGHIPLFVPIPTPGINFENEIKSRFSLNFELNNLFLIVPIELELGVREYLQKEKEFEGFYFYQGISVGWIDRFGTSTKYPYLVLTGGYKSIKESGFTVDPFVGVLMSIGRLFASQDLKFLLKFGILPILGLYFGYTWSDYF